MARPIKQGIDYFPLDCSFDDKTEMYLIETGAVGLGVLVTIWQMIYSNEGYFIKADEDLVLLVKKRIDVDINDVNSCINVAIKRCIFDRHKHKKYAVLTSKAIQKRFFSVTKRKKRIKACKEYLLIDINEYINSDNVDINWKDVSGNATKESKVKESKGDYIKPLLSFPLNGNDGVDFDVYENDVTQWSESFPAVNIMQELRNCRQWSIDNPSRRKTSKGIRRHISAWLSKRQDKGGNGIKPLNSKKRRHTTIDAIQEWADEEINSLGKEVGKENRIGADNTIGLPLP